MEKLFSEFKPVIATEWRAQIEKDLKGEPYDSLVWKNENGIEVQPFYTAENLSLKYPPAFTHSDWDICTSLKGENSASLNTKLLTDLQRGASSFFISLDQLDPSVILKDIKLNFIQSAFKGEISSFTQLKKFLESSYDLKELKFSAFPVTLATAADLQAHLSVIDLFAGCSEVRTITIDATDFHNSNCVAFYELALIFSLLTEYLEVLSSGKNMPASDIVIKTGVNSDYFIQIAKLRAIRRLFEIFKKEYKFKNNLHLIIETGLTNKSVSDSYNNLLRSTVEAMAAVAGGCNELIVNDFDVFFERDRNLADRMSINQQLILKDECYMDKIADVSCGSFFIESITDNLASKALEKFKQIEKDGGFFVSLEKKIIENEIMKQARMKEELVKSGKTVVIGINKFRNEKEILSLQPEDIARIKSLSISNPVLHFELEHFFNLKNA